MEQKPFRPNSRIPSAHTTSAPSRRPSYGNQLNHSLPRPIRIRNAPSHRPLRNMAASDYHECRPSRRSRRMGGFRRAGLEERGPEGRAVFPVVPAHNRGPGELARQTRHPEPARRTKHTDKKSLFGIYGIGEAKVEQFGKAIIAVIEDVMKEEGND